MDGFPAQRDQINREKENEKDVTMNLNEKTVDPENKTDIATSWRAKLEIRGTKLSGGTYTELAP